MEQRLKYITLYHDAEVVEPYYLRCKVNRKSPYDERVMSMPQLTSMLSTETIVEKHLERKSGVYFFFIFNFENYYHFLYDTLPYLSFYFTLTPRPKLLLAKGHKFLQFQKEMLTLLGIDLENDIKFAVEEEAIYERLYVPSSLTHGHSVDGKSASNTFPSHAAHTIWKKLQDGITYSAPTPKKFYVSRRSHIHGDSSNIGTNYTTRRRCLNEDAVVELLKSYDFEEVFCETMSTEQKIATFKNATHIVGFIGGGMANTLFSPGHVDVGCILTPEFLRINQRFLYSMAYASLETLDITSLAPHAGTFSPYTRVQVKDESSPYFNKIGEVHGYKEDKCVVHLSTSVIAGFSLDANLVVVEFHESQLTQLDAGLNSPFVCNLEALKDYLDSFSAESKAA